MLLGQIMQVFTQLDIEMIAQSLQPNFSVAQSSRQYVSINLGFQRSSWRTLLAKAFSALPLRRHQETRMNAPICRSEHERSAPDPGALLVPVGAQEEARLLLRRQLPVIREMIRDLEEQTGAGRRYTMEKVVTFFRQQIGRGALAVDRRNAGVLSHLVDQLASASQHPIPDVGHFSDRAEVLLSLLLATV